MAARQLPRELAANVRATAKGVCRRWACSFPAKRQLTRTGGCSAAILSQGLIPGRSGAMLHRARFLFAALLASAASYPARPRAAAGMQRRAGRDDPCGMRFVGRAVRDEPCGMSCVR